MSDQSPHSPAPAYPPSGSREPDWTTGQGIGFLVALPGWILVPLGLIGAIVASSFAGGDRALSLISLGVCHRWAHVGGPRHHRLQQVQASLTPARPGPLRDLCLRASLW